MRLFSALLAAPLLASIAAAALAQDRDCAGSLLPPEVPRRIAGRLPIGIALADLNDDAIVDIASTNRWSNDVSILLGFGRASFSSEIRAPAGLGPVGLAAADLDDDGNLYLVTTNANSDDVAVLLNALGPDCNANDRLDACDLASGASADLDANGVLDECEGGGQWPGDANQDGKLGVADAIALLTALFLAGDARLPCGGGGTSEAGNRLLADWSGDGRLALTDALLELTWLFIGGPEHALGNQCRLIPSCRDRCRTSVR